MKRTLMLVCMIMIVYLQYGVVLFNDDFNRTEGSAVGNSWTNIGPVSPIIENSSMKVISNSLQGVRRDFTTLGITSGIYYVSYDWKITSNNWLADAFPNGTVTYLRHDYEGNLYYDNTSDFSNPITIGSLAIDTWANFKLKVNIDTDRFSLWINNTLVADNIAGLAVTDFTRFTFRAGSGSTVTQYIDNFIVYNETPPPTPTALSATGRVNDITLNWTGTPQDFLTYKIYRKTTSPADVFLAEVPGTQTTYTDVTAAANTDYFYRVKAVSMSTIESGFSNEVTAHLQPDISVSPQVIDVTVGQGYTGETSFAITNNGNYPLNWSIPVTNPIPTNGLVAHYPFDGNAIDVSGNGHIGTVSGASLSYDRFGNSNSAYSFDGINDIVTANTIGFPTGGAPRTLACWVKINQFIDGGSSVFVSYGNHGVFNASYGIHIDDAHKLTFSQWGGSIYGSTTLEINQWYHCVVTSNGNNVRLYLNGILDGSGSLTINTSLGTNLLYFGNLPYDSTPRILNGLLDCVSLHNRELSTIEIQSMYQNSLPQHITVTPTVGLINNGNAVNLLINVFTQNLTNGTYSDTLFVDSNDPDTPSIPVIVNLTVAPGDIAVAPTQFTAELNSASNTSNTSFNITNTGLGKLDYSITGTDSFGATATLPPISDFTAMGIFNGHTYYRSNNTMTWAEAEILCEQNGGHLATVSNSAENTYLSQNITYHSWIGLHYNYAISQWEWVTGEPVAYVNWASGEPNNINNLTWDTALIYTNSYWNDDPSSLFRCVLEFDSLPATSILSFIPTNGVIETSAIQSVAMTIDGTSLADGLYETSAMLVSNAPEPRDTLFIPVTVKVDYTPPTAPLGLAFDEVQSDMNQIYISWTANALADSVYSYKVFRRGLHDTLWSLKGTVDADHNWFIDNQFTGLDTTAVYYKITAIDWIDNESTASEEVMAWLQRFPAPTGLTMEIIRDRHVQLTWNPVTQTISGNPGTPSCYVIYRSNTPSPIEDFYFVGAVDATTFTHNWAAWFIEIGKQFYVVTAYSGSFEDLRAVAESRSEWKYGEIESALQENPLNN